MKLKTSCFIVTLICLAALPIFAQNAPLSGTWTGDWGPTPTHRNPVTVDLKWDGKALSGTVNPGANAIALQKTSFDSKTGVVHLEADAAAGANKVHYVIDGKLENGAIAGSWNHDNRKGDFKITKK